MQEWRNLRRVTYKYNMSSAPPPPPRKRRPEENAVGSPPRTRTRGEQAAQNDKAAKVFEAMSTWHMGAERRESEYKWDNTLSGKTVTEFISMPAEGHGGSLFQSLERLSSTSRGMRNVFDQYRAGLLDASQLASASSGTQRGYDNFAHLSGTRNRPNDGNARSRRMMAQLRARDEAGRFTSEQQ